MRPLAALLLLAVPATAAPRLADRPLAPYERQVAEGVRVFGGHWGWVRVVKVERMGDNRAWYCTIRMDRPEALYETVVPRSYVAEWLRDYPENRKGRK